MLEAARMPQPALTTQLFSSPCGELLLASHEERLCLCSWQGSCQQRETRERLQRRLRSPLCAGDSPVLQQARAELRAYFAGEQSPLQTPLLLLGTPFQQHVWQHLQQIPCGSTRSYAELAQEMGCPGAARAVASACRANALCLFIPCHRIICSTGAPGGYTGGVEAKRFLLHHEFLSTAVFGLSALPPNPFR